MPSFDSTADKKVKSRGSLRWKDLQAVERGKPAKRVNSGPNQPARQQLALLQREHPPPLSLEALPLYSM